MPTLTYPSHVTLLTGVTPATHGVTGNLTFDPFNTNQYGWDWYASDIQVPTLWDAAHAAGLSTANVHWPVSVGAQVDWNLPQIWRTGNPDDRKLLAALATPGLLPSWRRTSARIRRHQREARRRPGPCALRGEAARAAPAAVHDRVLRRAGPRGARQRPRHARGRPGAGGYRCAGWRGAGRCATRASGRRGRGSLRSRLRAGGAGREPLCALHPGRAHHDQGRRHQRLAGRAVERRRQRGDRAARSGRRRTEGARSALLQKLQADPAYGIGELLDHEAVVRKGGAPNASWFVVFKPGFEMGIKPDAPMPSPGHYKGMHGYDPATASMRATFLIAGKGIPAGRTWPDRHARHRAHARRAARRPAAAGAGQGAYRPGAVTGRPPHVRRVTRMDGRPYASTCRCQRSFTQSRPCLPDPSAR